MPRRLQTLQHVCALLLLCALICCTTMLMAGRSRGGPGFARNRSGAQRSRDYERFCDAFVGLQVDPTRTADVRHLRIARDVGSFDLEQGRLMLCRPLGGRVCAAVFVGRGTFSFQPSDPVEQEQLRRLYRSPSLQRPFRSLVLFFADSTLRQLRREVAFHPGAISGREGIPLGEALDHMCDPRSGYVRYEIAKTFLEGERNSLFYAHVGAVEGEGPLVFELDPYSTEEVVLMRDPSAGDGTGRHTELEVVSQFPRKGVNPASLESDDRPTLAMQHYDIDCTIDRRLGLSASARLRFESLRGGQRWLPFWLDYQLQVDSVRWESGRAAPFFRGEESPVLWVECGRPTRRGQRMELRVWYHGDVIERLPTGFSIKALDGWYPEHDPKDKATFNLVYHLPAGLRFASVGELAAEETHAGMTTSRWTVSDPIQNASFNLGFFTEYRVAAARRLPVTVLMSREGHASARVRHALAAPERMEREVGADVANSISFFQGIFGPPPTRRFFAAETPEAHGEAFPGLIRLSSLTFENQDGDADGEEEIFRAHEVAHQWWPYGVDYKTYHDEWLSEGMAEYSALWYLQAARHNDQKFHDALDSYRDDILGHRGDTTTTGGSDQGPVWLGRRNNTSTSRGDFDLVVYKKGAWVLHMLRSLLSDPRGRDDSRFVALMHDFYSTYRGRSVSTQDFERMASRYMREDMGWFFREWVRGTNIPTYRFAYRTSRLPGPGGYQVTCRIRQSGVPADFRMYVPVHVELSGGRAQDTRTLVQGPQVEFTLPPTPDPPIRVSLDDQDAVLCAEQDVAW